MGLPQFRFTLSHNATSRQISEPMGWVDAVMKMERSPDFHSLVEYFEGSFIYYGSNGVDDGGIDFIRNIEWTYGFDAEIRSLIEITFNGSGYEEVYNGVLELSDKQEVNDNKLEVPTIQTSEWIKFKNRINTPVDPQSTTDLDGNPVSPVETVTVDLPSQRVRQKYSAYLSKNAGFPGLSGIFIGSAGVDDDTNDYVQFDWNEESLREIEEKFSLPIASNPSKPVNIFKVKYSGDYVFDAAIDIIDNGPLPLQDVRSFFGGVYLQINGDVTRPFSNIPIISSGSIAQVVRYFLNDTIYLNAGDELIIYGFRNSNRSIIIAYQQSLTLFSTTVDAKNYINLTADTEYPQTQVEAYYLHDALAGVVQRITGSNIFYSEIFGRTDTNLRTYASNGCYSPFVVLKGLQLRGYTLSERPAAFSFEHLLNGADPIFNLGLGYEIVASQYRITLDQKAAFYDRSSVSVNIDNVKKITKEYDKDRIYKKVEIGYRKWESEDISGLDDPQAKHTYATRFQKVGNDITLFSEFIAAGIAIEVTRRQTIEKNKDYKYDNETFIIHLNNDDVSPDRYRPELSENFNSVTGLLNSNYRYNLVLTPLRNFLRWANYFNGALQKYLTSSYKFVAGEGNYAMASDYSCGTGAQCLAVICDNLAENQDISLATYGPTLGFIHLPDLFTIEIDLSWDDYLAIRNNRKKAIGVSQTTSNHKKFFIKELSYELCRSKATITMWAAEEFMITVPESNQPSIPECADTSVEELESTMEGSLTDNVAGSITWGVVVGSGSFQMSTGTPTYSDDLTDITPFASSIATEIHKVDNSGIALGAGTVVWKVNGSTVHNDTFSLGEDCSFGTSTLTYTFTGLVSGDTLRVEIVEG